MSEPTELLGVLHLPNSTPQRHCRKIQKSAHFMLLSSCFDCSTSCRPFLLVSKVSESSRFRRTNLHLTTVSALVYDPAMRVPETSKRVRGVNDLVDSVCHSPYLIISLPSQPFNFPTKAVSSPRIKNFQHHSSFTAHCVSLLFLALEDSLIRLLHLVPVFFGVFQGNEISFRLPSAKIRSRSFTYLRRGTSDPAALSFLPGCTA